MAKLNLYLLFHLNLCYSSIPENKRKTVIERCYWPLLRLAKDNNIPLAIELSGYTLEQIHDLDHKWVEEFRALLKDHSVELVASGYAQIIGPLVPAEVNAYNFYFGNQVYQDILGVDPELVYVNEQAFSKGMIAHFTDAKFKAMIMEWNNPYRFHPQWDAKWRYYPQKAVDDYGHKIDVIWNNAIAFQKFQRYAQAQIEIDEYLAYLKEQIGNKPRIFSLNGNDAEVFDFRPGRFMGEAKISPQGEWKRIYKLMERLKSKEEFSFIFPSQVPGSKDNKLSGHTLHLESSSEPIPVKKQEKYNITRWAVSGRDDTRINTLCYRIYANLKLAMSCRHHLNSAYSLWKQLCYLWDSDFRTHIEAKRWKNYQLALNKVLAKTYKLIKAPYRKAGLNLPYGLSGHLKAPRVTLLNKKIAIENKHMALVLNLDKGLAIDSLTFKKISPEPLLGTIPHGYFDDIAYSADFFSGHTIIELEGMSKVTDLVDVSKNKNMYWDAKSGSYQVSVMVKTKFGPIHKQVRFFTALAQIDIAYKFDLRLPRQGSLRTGIITLLPQAFLKKRLYYRTVNGGYHPEEFSLDGQQVCFTTPVNRLISSSNCLGATSGWVQLGDREHSIIVQTDKSQTYSVPMIEFQPVKDSYFLRCSHSIKETDDTSWPQERINKAIHFTIRGV